MRIRTERHDVSGRVRSAAPARHGALLVALLALLPLDAAAVSYRYASSSNRIYAAAGGTTTLSAIKAALPGAPLEELAPRVWLLRANLILQDGVALQLHGSAAGGDVDELRLASGPAGFIYVSAEYGALDVLSTRIRSWDPAAGTVDTQHSDGRAFIRVRSYLDADGVTPRESRMDIVDSDIGYLGWADAESYGLVWKVIGKSPGLYDKVNVYGDIRNSRLHHNYFGMYSYGHEGGQWTGNEVDHNVKYGFDPHDDSDNLLIEDNDVHDNGNHGIIASKRCHNVVIRNNRSWGNTGNGIMVHRASDDALVEGNDSYLNSDSGIALFASRRAVVRNNRLLDNGKYGIRLSLGQADSRIESNEIAYSGKYGIFLYRGSDTPEPGDDGRPKRNVFYNNDIHDIPSDALKVKDSDDNRFVGNAFRAIGGTLRLVESTDTRFQNNAVPSGTQLRLEGSSGIASNVDVYDQPELKVRLDAFSTASFRDAGNAIFDPDEYLFTSASPTSSLLTLSAADIGTSTTVHTRALRAVPAAGKVRINPSLWETAGDRAKEWRVRADDAQVTVAYEVGDLAPATVYDVRRGATLVATRTADGAGRIVFSDASGSTSTVTYSVRPR